MSMEVNPIDTERWGFKAERQYSNRITIEVRGSLLKKTELTTIVLLKGYTSKETAEWVNSIFIILLLIILGIMSMLIAAKALALAVLLGIITLFPLFMSRFVEFDDQSSRDRQQLEHLIKRSLE